MIDSVLKKIMNNLKTDLSADFSESTDSQKSSNSTKKAVVENKSIWNFNDINFFDFNYEKKLAAIEKILTHLKKTFIIKTYMSL